jgi:predicted enzyme related to lactoylglutathione lyase
MFQGLRTIVYYVANLEQAKSWYSNMLGYGPYFDEPFYVGFNVSGYELGLLPRDEKAPAGATGGVTYWGVANIADGLAAVVAQGALAADPIEDVGGGIKVATVHDPDGNIIGLIENPHFKLPENSNLSEN